MYKFTTMPEESALTSLRFEKVDAIISPNRITQENLYWLGQTDEKQNPQSVWVLHLPFAHRFYKSILLNYRGEVRGITSGFMAGGIEVQDLSDKSEFDSFCFGEREQFTDFLIKIIDKLLCLGMECQQA